MRLWHVRRARSCAVLFEARPWTVDPITKEWRPEQVRLLATTVLGARALTPAFSVLLRGANGIIDSRQGTEFWGPEEIRAKGWA